MLPPLPISYAALERYRLRLTDRLRAAASGGQLTQRKGQSLEFREYAPYVPGDDVRHIDWSATERRYGDLEGDSGDFLARRFLAEEQFRLVISLDTRSTMSLPGYAPKRQIAAWVAEAIAWIALRSGHRVTLHRLFGAAEKSIYQMHGGKGGATGGKRVRAGLELIGAGRETDSEQPNLAPLVSHLPPAAIWLIVSDLYFADMQQVDFMGETARRLARQVVTARNGLRWVLLIDLDSWPYERRLVETAEARTRAWRIHGPGAMRPDERVQIEERAIEGIENDMRSFRERFLWEKCGLAQADVSQWRYDPAGKRTAAEAFVDWFASNTLIPRIFARWA